MKTEIEYTNHTLYIFFDGEIDKKGINRLKHKLYHILNEYQIVDIIMDIRNAKLIAQDSFYDFLDDYDAMYGGNLEVVE